MSQQKQQSWRPPNDPQCSLPQCSNPCLAPCLTPGGAPRSEGCHSSSQRPAVQKPRRARRKPRCLSGGTTYHCREEECIGD
ncbi:late cornified envelope protein 6A [Saimiri boliviensis]|uniref:late cornified envelope protein 6A n=1 Tax=Saimiri boliviensis TaxID=27679 RepID=UPI00027FB8B9|nr:late cornified envelope protein 6A [Saimiri boliviensis boliviensis]XP_010327975.1 late cornified envelope protein 6A [Saimiri boliviensis boliviensis]